MNGYQPPLVPQSAVTFGDERLVDPWAETMLRNTCSNFQVQNMALQQENGNRQISRRMDTHGIIVVERFATFHYY